MWPIFCVVNIGQVVFFTVFIFFYWIFMEIAYRMSAIICNSPFLC
jgi:hypothetical protein